MCVDEYLLHNTLAFKFITVSPVMSNVGHSEMSAQRDKKAARDTSELR